MTALRDDGTPTGKCSDRPNHAVGIYIVVAWLFDLSIMFPYVQVEPDDIPWAGCMRSGWR